MWARDRVRVLRCFGALKCSSTLRWRFCRAAVVLVNNFDKVGSMPLELPSPVAEIARA